MIYIPIDNEGDSTDGWDTYGPMFYSSTFIEDKIINMNDGALWMPEKKKSFNVLSSGFKSLIPIGVLSVLLIILYRRRLSFSRTNLFTGILIVAVIVVTLIRMQMNKLWNQNQFHVFGSIAK
jgi:hypothetical protein